MADTALEEALRLAGQGGLARPVAPLSPAEARAVCREVYGLDGTFTRLATEKDDTFRVVTPRSDTVLKIANPAEDEGELDLQLSALAWLEGFAIPVPRVVRTQAGALMQPVTLHGEVRLVRMMRFVDGTPLDMLPPGAGAAALPRWNVGRATAQLRMALAGFRHPAQGRRLAWDVRHAALLRPLLDQVTLDPAQMALAHAAFDRLETLRPRIDALPRQVLHNDLHRSNILCDPASPDFVTGIIDFGDIVETAVAVDLSTMLLGQLGTDPATDIFAPAAPVLEGYRAHAPLADEELALLPHLVMARALLRAVLNQWRAVVMPDKADYVLRNTGPSWGQVGWFMSRDEATISAHLAPQTEISR